MCKGWRGRWGGRGRGGNVGVGGRGREPGCGRGRGSGEHSVPRALARALWGPCIVAFENMVKYAALQRAQLHLDFIHANSTTHSFLFGALAELLDNARDAGATRLDVFSVDNEKLQGGFMLCFLDDGCGMGPEDASDIIYFGTSKKRLSAFKFIGQYGNGLKSGSMRIGKDFILFTKKEETMTCLFFSQTFCETEGLTEVVVPIPSWITRTRESVTDDPQKFSTELSIIYKYSPFKNEVELMQQFDMIYGKCGTLVIIYNLKLLLSGEPELDVKTDKEDILMAGALEDFPERCSFRAYASVLYFDPGMRIYIQAKRVQTKILCHCLYKPRKYLYVTSSFKGIFKSEVKKAEEAVKIAELVLKEAQIKTNQPNTISLPSAENVLQKALEDIEAKRKNLNEKQRELRKARTLSLYFGVNIENQSQAGVFIYSNNRLIKMHEKVGPQLKLKSLLGAGVVGIVNIPLEIMELSHNKQEFLNVQEYGHLLRVMGQYLVQYCKDTGMSNRNLTMFWNDLGYQQNKDIEKSSEIQYQRRQAMAIPFMLQCDLCLKWRVLPYPTDFQEMEFLDMWICASNPNLSENSCDQVERLPSIPLGTMNTASSSKSERQKQLRESIQKYQNKLAEIQPQPQLISSSKVTGTTSTLFSSAPKLLTQTQKLRIASDNLKHGSLSSLEFSVNHRDQKRNPEGAESYKEYVPQTKIVKKSSPKPQQQRDVAALPENIELSQRSQVAHSHKEVEINFLIMFCAGERKEGRVPTSHKKVKEYFMLNPATTIKISSWSQMNMEVMVNLDCHLDDPIEKQLEDYESIALGWGDAVCYEDIDHIDSSGKSLGVQCSPSSKCVHTPTVGKVLRFHPSVWAPHRNTSDQPYNTTHRVLNKELVFQILDEDDTDVALKQESHEVLLVNREKKEQYNGISAIKGKPSLFNQKNLPRMPVEDIIPSCGREARVSVSVGDHVASSLVESSQSASVKETVRKLTSILREILQYFVPECQLPPEFEYTSVEELLENSDLEQCPEQTNEKLKICFNQIQNLYMVHYEKRLKRKIQSLIYHVNRRGILNEISWGQCEQKRKMVEGKLNDLRTKVAVILQKLQLGGPVGDLEQIDAYLESLLQEDNAFLQKTLNKGILDWGHKSRSKKE
ncbi:MORC family CW-type zinc finger protein 1 [Perognathus longimembris pacificus]|uniref:MORC family CW-type zinc finger protein 1 n=1 Tax=Perognathus longimembris pacificus TaxID=214514 RepID=UPI00201A0592|nr:MORC family CW-type zinc finger protein 1 [Perognathus longimembris pacificus]